VALERIRIPRDGHDRFVRNREEDSAAEAIGAGDQRLHELGFAVLRVRDGYVMATPSREMGRIPSVVVQNNHSNAHGSERPDNPERHRETGDHDRRWHFV
jgi:hypothetical protein